MAEDASIRRLLTDPANNTYTLLELRTATGQGLSDEFVQLGQLLWVGAWFTRNACMEGVVLLTQMIGQSASGVVTMLKVENWYAVSVVLRQQHYLSALFANDPTQAERWVHASTNRIEKSFNPSQMRSAGGFRATEYKKHCEQAGHPNPHARWMLPDHNPHIPHALLWVDLNRHLVEITDSLLRLAARGDCDWMSAQGHMPHLRSAHAIAQRWRTRCPTASQFLIYRTIARTVAEWVCLLVCASPSQVSRPATRDQASGRPRAVRCDLTLAPPLP